MSAFLLVFAMAFADTPQKAVKPWERKVQVPVPVPVELPPIPPTNPFFTPLTSLPQHKQLPMREDFPVKVPASFAIYVDKEGNCRRVQPLTNPLPGVIEPVRQALLEERFAPAKSFGQPAATWVDVAVDLRGEVKEGRLGQLVVSLPDPEETPKTESLPVPPANARDAQLPSTPGEQLSAAPQAKRFWAKVPGQEFRQPLKLLAEVSAQGRVKRVVFLLCPEGLRAWVLASSANWLFVPGRTAAGPADAWVLLTGAVDVKMSALRAEGLRVGRTSSYPPKAANP